MGNRMVEEYRQEVYVCHKANLVEAGYLLLNAYRFDALDNRHIGELAGESFDKHNALCDELERINSIIGV